MAGAAVIGLAIGALVGSAIADATAPPGSGRSVGDLRQLVAAPQWSWVASRTTNCDDYSDDYGYGYNPRPNYYWNGYEATRRLAGQVTDSGRAHHGGPPFASRHAGRTRSR